MAWTRHGHHIRGTKEFEGVRPPVARCGGPAVCGQCSQDAQKALHELHPTRIDPPEEDKVREETMFKVDTALERAGLTVRQRMDAVNEILNEGILFRERN